MATNEQQKKKPKKPQVDEEITPQGDHQGSSEPVVQGDHQGSSEPVVLGDHQGSSEPVK